MTPAVKEEDARAADPLDQIEAGAPTSQRDLGPMDLVDLVAEAVMDKIEERKHLDVFLDHVIARVGSWREEMGEAGLAVLPSEARRPEDPVPAAPDAPARSSGRHLFHRFEDDEFSALRTRILVSCFRSGPAGGGIFELDFGANSYRQVVCCDARGIAKYGHGYIAASRDSGIFVLDENLAVVKNHPMAPLDLHGVACGPDDLVYLVETRHNRVGIYAMEPFERVGEIVVSPDATDRNHLNDICFRDGRLLLSMFSTQEFWRKNVEAKVFDGAIIEYDTEEKKPLRQIASGLKMPHTLKLVDGELCYCESFGLSVVRSEVRIAQFFGYTRGLDHDGRYFFVGQSGLRHRERHPELTVSGDAGVHILAQQEHLSRFVPLPTPDVYGILVLK